MASTPLTRKDMERVITEEGGSVMLSNGQIVTRVQDLPSEADLAQGDPQREETTAARLQEQINRLQADLARLLGTGGGTGGTGGPAPQTPQTLQTPQTGGGSGRGGARGQGQQGQGAQGQGATDTNAGSTSGISEAGQGEQGGGGQ